MREIKFVKDEKNLSVALVIYRWIEPTPKNYGLKIQTFTISHDYVS